ncbi:MAG: hypothetical protein RL291_561 [Pseudomonadota bacterium]
MGPPECHMRECQVAVNYSDVRETKHNVKF